MDGVINETPRGLALRGARVLLNSLNSFALDEAALHVPVRAAENKVFVVGANKVGSLVPPELAEQIATRMSIRADQLHGAGGISNRRAGWSNLSHRAQNGRGGHLRRF